MSEIDWTDWVVVAAALRPVIHGRTHFPTLEELRELKLSELADAIETHHGGMEATKQQYHSIPKIRPRGFWKSRINVFRELQGVVYTLGHFPTSSWLQENGFSSLGVAINKSGGIHAWRDRMICADSAPEKPKGYWDKWEHARSVLKELEETLGHFPSQREIQTAGYHTLSDAIRDKQRFGGIEKVRKRYGASERDGEANGHWDVWENVENRLRDYWKELGSFPTRPYLHSRGEGGLVGAITRKWGGLPTVRKRLGLPERVIRESGYWQNWENVRAELQRITEITGQFPFARHLRDSEETSLLKAMCTYHGGFPACRERMGYARLSEATIAAHMERITTAYMAKTDVDDMTFDMFLTTILEECADETQLREFLART